MVNTVVEITTPIKNNNHTSTSNHRPKDINMMSSPACMIPTVPASCAKLFIPYSFSKIFAETPARYPNTAPVIPVMISTDCIL